MECNYEWNSAYIFQAKSPSGTKYTVEADSEFYTVPNKLLVPPHTNSPRKTKSAPSLHGMNINRKWLIIKNECNNVTKKHIFQMKKKTAIIL